MLSGLNHVVNTGKKSRLAHNRLCIFLVSNVEQGHCVPIFVMLQGWHCCYITRYYITTSTSRIRRYFAFVWNHVLPDWAILCTPSFLKVFKCCLSNYSFLEIPTVNENSIFHFEMLRTFQSSEERFRSSFLLLLLGTLELRKYTIYIQWKWWNFDV